MYFSLYFLTLTHSPTESLGIWQGYIVMDVSQWMSLFWAFPLHLSEDDKMEWYWLAFAVKLHYSSKAHIFITDFTCRGEVQEISCQLKSGYIIHSYYIVVSPQSWLCLMNWHLCYKVKYYMGNNRSVSCNTDLLFSPFWKWHYKVLIDEGCTVGFVVCISGCFLNSTQRLKWI